MEKLDFVKQKLETPSGTARVLSILKMNDLGYDVERLPFSIRVLLENALRHSPVVAGASEAALSLAGWPSGVGRELPFMPYRVLLQDYTGVPLIVDLAGMRDAARSAGLRASLVNSKVPVDLVIDHSIQVDAWSSDAAFAINLEKEYERNSERYALLKWAQSSFKGLRVFPPGKGICHQVNLEYISRVVALSEASGELEAFPDTLVGTDSHTTMVNGLGVLGWGVGGIEAEAVMLGEPYHMPIPKVLGVKLTGGLREGVTPTDMVLAVTERLRERDVVGSFVEFFGDGFRQLSVPDRATLGNMSPEYGATVGFSPVDDNTLAYLTGTGRAASYVDFVKRYAMANGFFSEGAEPRYSDVMTIDLSSIEPSISGPRNPEERRSLASVPSFSRGLFEKQESPMQQPVPPVATVPTPSGGQRSLLREGASNLLPGDGAVVIAAITSCTNTSNPTVMIGAGLLARNAIEKGLSAKPWVKRSLAPGSTVVTDYLSNAGLLGYLDRLGFALVGYGCTSCIAEGTPVLLGDGTSRRIESMPTAGGIGVFAPTAEGGLRIARQSRFMANGVRDCVELVLQDGRSLVCTPDHQILCSDGRWVRADLLEIGRDRAIVGFEAPIDTPRFDESGYTLRAGSHTFSMKTESERAKTLAFARLLGYLIGDGSISVAGQGRLSAGQAVDRAMMLNDIELITGFRPAANRYDERKWSVVLPMTLSRAMMSLAGVQTGKRIQKPPTLPDFVTRPDCPLSVVREFLGGLFGADGQAPSLHRYGGRDEDSTLGAPAFSLSTIPALVERAKGMMQELVLMLAKCGVETKGTRVSAFPTRRSASSYPAARDGVPRIEVRLTLSKGLSFIDKVGFRYSVDKIMRASAAAVYWRIVEGISRQRIWVADRLVEVHQSQPSMSFSRARQAVSLSLLSHEREHSLPPVVAPHYALLEGYDRFSRLPTPASRRFTPLHRDSCDFPSPVALLTELGVRDWFAPLQTRADAGQSRRYVTQKEALTLPAFSLRVVDRRPAGLRAVYDLTVDHLHAFVAGTVAVHNCIGNSGPLDPRIEKEIKERDLYAVAVLSGNRNFDGRIHPLARGSFLMSPMLVVAYSLAGRIDFDFTGPLGTGKDGTPVYLKDLWPSLQEIRRTAESSLSPALYERRYAEIQQGDERWNALSSYVDDVYHWDEGSTYIRRPPWFDTELSGSRKKDILGARALVVLEDKVTTDHISPAGTIPVDGPAGQYLISKGVDMIHFSSFGSRRGNHEVMVRGGFSNIRLNNLLARGKTGGWTTHVPSGRLMSIYDASRQYSKEGTPLIVIAGSQYGAGSSRDWAAKAPRLLGVRAVLAEDFERIHRSNLIAMGIVPLQFSEGEGRASLGLTGEESFDVRGISVMTSPGQWLDAVARGGAGEKRFKVRARLDNDAEMRYLESGGVLPFVFNKILRAQNG
jgi:aconitase A